MAIKFLNDINADSGVLYVDTSNDRVGIGTASPGVKLQVGDGSTDDRIRSYFSDGEYTEITGYGINFSRTFAQITPTTDAAQSLYIGDNSFSWGNIFTDAALHRFGHNADVFMTINHTGNVGIGTTNPGAKLEVNGDGTNTGGIALREGTNQVHYIYTDGPYQYNTIGSSSPNWRWGQQGADTKMALNNTGLGIGTTSPDRKLHVIGSEWNNTSGGGVIFENSNTVGASLTWKPSASVVTNGANGWAVYAGGPAAAIGDGNLGFWSHGTNEARMVIQRGGNVGIGTTSPAGKFHSYISANRQMGHNAVGGDLGVISDNNSAPVLYVKGTGTADLVNVFDNTTNVFTIKDGGNVGIGTASPTQKLHVDGTGLFTDFVRFNGTTAPDFPVDIDSVDGGKVLRSTRGTSIFRIDQSNDGPGYIGMQSADDLSIQTNNTSKMYITSSGMVGIGTTSPGAKLEVAGRVRATTDPTFEAYNTSANRGGLQWVNSSLTTKIFSGGSSGAGANIIFETNTSEKVRIDSSGNVGIGTTSPSAKLHVAGNVLIGTNGADETDNPPANFADLHIHTLTDGQPIAQDDAASLVISTGANQTGVQGWNGTLWFGNSDYPAAGNPNNSTGDQFNYKLAGIGSYADTDTGASNNGSGDLRFFTTSAASTPSQKMIITRGGNVGIGTTSPWTKLVLDGDPQAGTPNAGVVLAFDGGSYAEHGYRFKANGANYYQVLYDGSAINWKNYAGGASYTTRMSLTNAGNVGIGTTLPNALLDVNKSTIGEYAYFGSGSTRQLRLSSYNTVSDHAGHKINASSGNGEITLATNSVAAVTVKNDQTVQLNAYTAGYVKSDANGNLTVDNSTFLQQEVDTLASVTSRGAATSQVTYFNGTVNIGASVGMTFSSSAEGATYMPTESTVGTSRFFLRFDTTDDASFPYLTNRTPSGAVVIKTGTAVGGAENEHFRIKGGDGTVDAYFTDVNLGIGTTSPNEKLHVEGNARIGSNGTSGRLKFSRPVGGQDSAHVGYHSAANGDFGLSNLSGGGNIIFNSNDGYLRFNNISNSNALFFVSAAGNVGIGTTSPGAKLNIATSSLWGTAVTDAVTIDNTGSAGDINSEHSLGRIRWRTNGVIGASIDAIRDTPGAGNNVDIAFSTNTGGSSTSAAERMRINYNGNVGIGTDDPTGLTSGVGSLSLGGTSSTVSGGLFYQVNGTYKAYSFVSNNAYIHRGQDDVYQSFWTDATEKMRITTTGNVGIGTTSPSKTLSINSPDSSWDVANWKVNNGKQGTLYADTAGVGFYVGTSAFSTYVGSYFNESEKAWDVRTNGAVRIKINSSGNVGIGTTSPTQSKLVVDGDISVPRGNALVFLESITGGFRAKITSQNTFPIFNGLEFYTGGVGTAPKMIISDSGNLQLLSYGAGILKTDANGNVSLDTSTYIPTTDYDDFVNVGGDTMTGNLLLEDSVELRLGTDTDLKIYHDGTTGRIANNTGHLYIQNLSDDKDIYLRSDDGAGGLSTYLSIDGSDGLVNITKPLTLSNYGAGILKTDASGVVSVDTSAYLTSYTETQTLDDVTDLGNSTTNSISVGAITLTDDPASSNGTFVKVYEDTHKRMYTANLNFSFTAAGTYNFNLVFPNGGGYHYDLIAVNSRNDLYRNFGTLKDSSYIYWESDQDFTHRAEGDIHLISSYTGGMYFSADTTYFLSDGVTDSVQTGSANWSYAIVRYSVYIPRYDGDVTGSWKLHLTTYGDTGSNVPQFVLA